MAININWENLTGGDDGLALAESIRAFIHERFQQVALPGMIRSVNVHSFDFGTVAPDLVLKDVSDPLPDFYNDSDDEEDSTASKEEDTLLSLDEIREASAQGPHTDTYAARPKTGPINAKQELTGAIPHRLQTEFDRRQSTQSQSPIDNSSFLGRAPTPGIPGGTANFSSFHPSLAAGIHGSTSPLTAMAGAHLPHGWLEAHSQLSNVQENDSLIQSSDLPASGLASPGFRPALSDGRQSYASDAQPDRSSEDVQVVVHLRYAGDIKMTMTADILLDYPMPSFVSIPLQIKLTGLSFDGIAILAYIKKKAHFCFLSPEDAEALVGHESGTFPQKDSSPTFQNHSPEPQASDAPKFNNNQHSDSDKSDTTGDFDHQQPSRIGGLFEDVRIESEIGDKANGKQVLKNVGKVEKFILEQVRHIFASEFVHPNFWTFLI